MTDQPQSPEGTGEATKQQASHVAGYARDSASDVASTAQQQAADVAGTAKERAQDVAGTAAEKGKETVAEARQQARALLDQSRTEVTEQASRQQRQLADTMRSFSSELESMATRSDEQGMAADLARQASQYVGRAGQWLEEREPGDLLQEVKRFARNRPGAFLAISAGLGLVVGRVARGLKDASSQEEPSTSPYYQRSDYATPSVETAGYATGGYGTTGAYTSGGYVSGTAATQPGGYPAPSTPPPPPPTIPPTTGATGSRHGAALDDTTTEYGPAHGLRAVPPAEERGGGLP